MHIANPRAPPLERSASSIEQFCIEHSISKRFYYSLRAAGLGPDEIRIGSRVLISRESASRWRAKHEAASAA
jgi:hypothetical protein